MPVHNRLLLALAVVFLLAGLLLAVAARGAGPLPGDLAVTNWLQQLAPAGSIVGTVLRRASTTGSISVAMLLVVLVIRGQRRVGLFSLAGGIGALALGELLIKEIVARPRPNTDVLSVAQLEYGFPSTTTMTGVVVLGLLCY
ncbi:MAG TPA: hypothetical protein VER55_01325, partial [Ardenticatenaceae bacterium]|nr:hypothetical protein [Ardenticatenaceae bacterium]